jgi:hypothetical protein
MRRLHTWTLLAAAAILVSSRLVAASPDAPEAKAFNGGSVAVCYFGFGNWIALNKASLSNPAQCAVS